MTSDKEREMIKDSSLFLNSTLSDDIDKNLTDIEYRDRLVSLLQPILDKHFSVPEKRRIKPYKSRITFACPYCNDSASNLYAKRGNFILSGKFKNYFKCHNCNEFKRIDHFFKDWGSDLQLDVINYISSNLNDFSNSSNEKYDISMLLDEEEIDSYAIDRSEFINKFQLEEISDSNIKQWLNNRLQYDYSKFLYNRRKNYLFILNNTKSGKIIGFQIRVFNQDKNKYKTYKLSKIYELLKLDSTSIPDHIDDISTIFNIFNININRQVTLFEGPLDAFLYKNSVANCGANKSFIIDMNIRYWYDYDKTGNENAIEEINKGNSIFLWNKLLQEHNLPNRKKWDLTDVLCYMKKNNIKTPNFENYFSNDSLDLIDL